MLILLSKVEMLGSKGTKSLKHPKPTGIQRGSRTSSPSISQQWREPSLYSQLCRRVCRYVHTMMSSAMISVRISSACRHWMKSSSTTSCLHRTVEHFRRALLSRSSMPHWNIFLGHAGDKDTDVFLEWWQTGSAQLMPTTALNVYHFDFWFDDCFVIASFSTPSPPFFLKKDKEGSKNRSTSTRSVASQHTHRTRSAA